MSGKDIKPPIENWQNSAHCQNKKAYSSHHMLKNFNTCLGASFYDGEGPSFKDTLTAGLAFLKSQPMTADFAFESWLSTLAPRTNKAGVASKVKIVANVKPPAIVLDRSVHHCEDGAPTNTSLSAN